MSTYRGPRIRVATTVLALTAATLAAGSLIVASGSAASAAQTSCSSLEIAAHRGYHAGGSNDPNAHDQNTAGAFQAAIDNGYSVETDIRKDEDGQLWFFHDDLLSDSTDGPDARIEDEPTAFLESLTYDKTGEPLLKFEEGMSILQAAPAERAYFEIKEDGFAQQVIDAVKDAGRLQTTWFTARQAAVHAREPDANLLRKAGGTNAPSVADLQQDDISIVGLGPAAMTAANVDMYHAASPPIEVQALQTTDPSVWQSAIQAGADGILTDQPEQLRHFCYALAPTAPTITSLSPTSGDVGSDVTITGTDLADEPVVTFGGSAAATLVSVSDNQLVVTVPSTAPASSAVTVTTPSGSATSADLFIVGYRPPPVITALSPTSGPVGTRVAIDGTDLDGDPTVTFGGVAASITSVSPTELVATAPAGAPPLSTVTVTTLSGSSNAPVPFTITAAPRVSPGTVVSAAPDTTFTGGDKGWLTSRKAKVHFTSDVRRSTFLCTLDGKAVPCAYPLLTLRHLGIGTHHLSVTAISPAGVADPTPATRVLAVPRDDSFLTSSSLWHHAQAKTSFGGGFLLTSAEGATLSAHVRKARSIVLLVRRGKGFGALRVLLDGKLIDTVHTSGSPGERLMAIHGFGKKASGRLTLVTASGEPVRVDGIGVSKDKVS